MWAKPTSHRSYGTYIPLGKINNKHSNVPLNIKIYQLVLKAMKDDGDKVVA